ADVGRTLFYALIVGLPTAALAGPVFARLIARRIALPAHNPMEAALLNQGQAHVPDDALPGFGITLATLLLPVGLMLLGGWADELAAPGSVANHVLRFL